LASSNPKTLIANVDEHVVSSVEGAEWNPATNCGHFLG
jgi:hypothetical protein